MTQPPLITPNQMLGARLYLGMSRERLSGLAGTTVSFISTYETKGRIARMFSRHTSSDGLAAIRAALEIAGIEFTDGEEPGVKLMRLSD